MADEINWLVIEKLAMQVTKSGESPGSYPFVEWKQISSALINLQEAKDWCGIIRLHELFSGLYARDSAWGIPEIQSLDIEAIDAARKLGDFAELGHLLGARGHNLHRQGYHKQAINVFNESSINYLKIGKQFDALKSIYMTSLCYRAIGDRTMARTILMNVLKCIEDDDPWRGNPIQVLAWLAQDEGKLPLAEKLLRKALDFHKQATNSDILIVGALADLGEVIGLQGRYSEAIEYFENSLIMLDKYHGQYDRQEARTRLKYAQLLMRMRNFDSAINLLGEADNLASGYGHYYDLMWQIELTHCLIFAKKGQFRNSYLKAQMAMRYRHILGLSSWLLMKQLLTYFLEGNRLINKITNIILIT